MNEIEWVSDVLKTKAAVVWHPPSILGPTDRFASPLSLINTPSTLPDSRQYCFSNQLETLQAHKFKKKNTHTHTQFCQSKNPCDEFVLRVCDGHHDDLCHTALNSAA
jgi:hypothetical protein